MPFNLEVGIVEERASTDLVVLKNSMQLLLEEDWSRSGNGCVAYAADAKRK